MLFDREEINGGRLTMIKINEVSAVGRPANMRTFLFVKQQRKDRKMNAKEVVEFMKSTFGFTIEEGDADKLPESIIGTLETFSKYEDMPEDLVKSTGDLIESALKKVEDPPAKKEDPPAKKDADPILAELQKINGRLDKLEKEETEEKDKEKDADKEEGVSNRDKEILETLQKINERLEKVENASGVKKGVDEGDPAKIQKDGADVDYFPSISLE